MGYSLTEWYFTESWLGDLFDAPLWPQWVRRVFLILFPITVPLYLCFFVLYILGSVFTMLYDILAWFFGLWN